MRLRGTGIVPNAPSGHRNRHKEFAGFLAGLREHSGERTAMLAAGFDNLAGQALGNFDCLGNAAPFRRS